MSFPLKIVCLAISCMQVLSLASIHGQTAPLAPWSIVLWRGRGITSLFVCCAHLNPQRCTHMHAFLRASIVQSVLENLCIQDLKLRGLFSFPLWSCASKNCQNTSRALNYMLFWLISALTVLLCNISCLDRLYIGCCVITLLLRRKTRVLCSCGTISGCVGVRRVTARHLPKKDFRNSAFPQTTTNQRVAHQERVKHVWYLICIDGNEHCDYGCRYKAIIEGTLERN